MVSHNFFVKIRKSFWFGPNQSSVASKRSLMRQKRSHATAFAVAQSHQTHCGAIYKCPNITHQFWSKSVIGNIQKVMVIPTSRILTISFSQRLTCCWRCFVSHFTTYLCFSVSKKATTTQSMTGTLCTSDYLVVRFFLLYWFKGTLIYK